MFLDERKKMILEAVIENYIATAEPIGSAKLGSSLEMKLSPATIRNVMADLEELGLITHPHTSAGRVPSDYGYRVYVNQLMRRYMLTAGELQRLDALMKLRLSEAQNLARDISRLYSRISEYAVVALTERDEPDYPKHIQLMPIDEQSILIVVVTNEGVALTHQAATGAPISYEQISVINEILNRMTCEKTLDKLCDIGDMLHPFSELFKELMGFIDKCVSFDRSAELCISGQTNLLKFPEYRDIDKARSLLEFLEDTPRLRKTLDSSSADGSVRVIIGDENEDADGKNCSIILSDYTSPDGSVGTIGFIGPTRMNYSRVVSILEYLTEELKKKNE